MRYFLTGAAFLVAAGQAAMAADCPVPYSEFEENIPHIDMAECPNKTPHPDKGFCRLVMDGNKAFIYAFTFTDDEPCLSAIRKAKKPSYLMR